MILASEDIGNADPMAMVVAASAAAEVERVGMPEATDYSVTGCHIHGMRAKEQCII